MIDLNIEVEIVGIEDYDVTRRKHLAWYKEDEEASYTLCEEKVERRWGKSKIAKVDPMIYCFACVRELQKTKNET